ncbi:MAG TPA: 4Fe-4S dicluster domain-containing protein [Gammaproteobacteria bacterium]|nr:4Fe-4S dicluster domain-containing protein [Gammaproteobacteria bacterium]
MPFWTLIGLSRGRASTRWPGSGRNDGQAGLLGMPRFEPSRCLPDCNACAEACLTGAIQVTPQLEPRVRVDYGRCIVCQLCTEQCPAGAFVPCGDWAFGVRGRDDLIWAQALQSPAARSLVNRVERAFGRSLHIRHVDAGSCNGCESELQALNNPLYNLHRLGIFFTPSPRFADLLLVTGPVTYAMRGPLLTTYEAMPGPRWVLACGTCAVSGGIAAGGYACGSGLKGVLPVDVYLPGCPPNPAALIEALLMLLERAPQRVQGGRIGV